MDSELGQGCEKFVSFSRKKGRGRREASGERRVEGEGKVFSGIVDGW